MDVVLTITAGPAAVGESRRLRAGQALKVGRGPDVDWPIADPALSARHFAVAADRSDPRAIHLGGGAVTVVDGRPVAQAVLTDASWLVAGHTHFTVSLQDPEQSLLGLRPPADVSPAAAAARFLAELGALHPLYALVDAARDPAILPTVHALDPRCASLLGNGSAHTLDPWAPWLTHVPIDPAPLLEAGWGRAWGIYLAGPVDFAPLYRHLKGLLRVSSAPELLFRYYDPRVLRGFLPSFPAEQARAFFGPLRAIALEAEPADALLYFRRTDTGMTSHRLALRADEGHGEGTGDV